MLVPVARQVADDRLAGDERGVNAECVRVGVAALFNFAEAAELRLARPPEFVPQNFRMLRGGVLKAFGAAAAAMGGVDGLVFTCEERNRWLPFIRSICLDLALTGLTLLEFGMLMNSLGMEYAVNMDGGGSTSGAMHLPDGTFPLINTPSDNNVAGTLRPLGSILGVSW